jgi:signal peptidase I
MRRGWLAGLATGAVALTGLALARRFAAVVTVDGDSMWPAFMPGDRVLVHRARARRVRTGQVVVVEYPGEDGKWPELRRGPIISRQWAIKRVAAVAGEQVPASCQPVTAGGDGQVPARKLILLGDNPDWSYDSREIGYIPAERLLGVVILRIARGGADWAPPGAQPRFLLPTDCRP